MDISTWSFICCEEHRQMAWTVITSLKKCSAVFSLLQLKCCDVTLRFMYILLVSASHLLPKPQWRVADSDSEYTYMSISSESETPKQSRQRSTKSPTKKSAASVPMDTTMLKARVLVAMASDEAAVSLQDFDNYLKRTNLKFFDPALCTDEKPYRCICIFGPPKVGKSDAASSLNSYT